MARWKPSAASGMVKHVTMLVSGTVVAQGLLVLITPIIFRLYSKEDLDALSGFSGLFFTFVTLMALRYEQAVPIVKERQLAVHILRLSTIISGTLSMALWAVLLLAGGPISRALGLSILAQHTWVLPLALFGGSLYLTNASWFTREQAFQITARTTVVQAVAMGVVQVGGAFVLAAQGGLALVLGLAIGRSMGVVSFWRSLRSTAEWKSAWSWGAMTAMLSRYRGFATYNTPGALAGNLGLQLPPVMFLALYPAGTAAAYYASMRVLGSPMSLLGAAVGQAYQGEAARLVRENPEELLPFFDRTMTKLAKVAAIMLVVGFSAPLWLDPLLGTSGNRAGIWAAMLTPSMCLGFICSPISMTANVLERLRGQLLLDLTRVLVTAATLGLPAFLGWSADQSVLLYSCGSMCLYLAYLLFYRSCAAGARKTSLSAKIQEP